MRLPLHTASLALLAPPAAAQPLPAAVEPFTFQACSPCPAAMPAPARPALMRPALA